MLILFFDTYIIKGSDRLLDSDDVCLSRINKVNNIRDI